MKSPSILLRICATLASLAVLALVGCSTAPKPRNYNLKIECDQALAGSSIQLDIIGANAISDLPKWQSYSVSDYWQPGNPMRRDAEKIVLRFGQAKSNTQVFSGTDPIWNRWLATGALYLVVIVDLPGIASDREGNADPRRLILPLDSREWPGNVETIELRVQEAGIRLLTPKRELK